MMDKQKENEMFIRDKLGKIKKGECPNFYITGKSLPAMENLAFQLAEKIIEEKLLPFKGLVTHFTIRLPYCEDLESADEFLDHFANSYSIARDCYDTFCGVILMEIADEWIYKGRNAALSKILDRMQKCNQVCFIFVVPFKEMKGKEDLLYHELIRCGIWLKIQSQTMSIEESILLFEKKAEENGLQVSKTAKAVLKKALMTREEAEIENVILIEKLIQQIMFDRRMFEDERKCIFAQKMVDILGTEKNTQKNTIGFKMENR